MSEHEHDTCCTSRTPLLETPDSETLTLSADVGDPVDSAQSKPWSFSTPLRSVATRASSRCKRSASFAKALLLAKLKDSRRWTRFSNALARLAALAPLLQAEFPDFKDGTYPGEMGPLRAFHRRSDPSKRDRGHLAAKANHDESHRTLCASRRQSTYFFLFDRLGIEKKLV